MIPSTNAAIAKPLVLGIISSMPVGALGSSELQELHTWALSGFCVPHFGQYIQFLPSILDIGNRKASFRLGLFFLLFVHFMSIMIS